MDWEVATEQIALRSAKWDNDERLKFIWKNTLIVANYKREDKFFQVLTLVGEDEEKEIKDWFYRMTHRGLLGEEESESDDQENSD